MKAWIRIMVLWQVTTSAAALGQVPHDPEAIEYVAYDQNVVVPMRVVAVEAAGRSLGAIPREVERCQSVKYLDLSDNVLEVSAEDILLLRNLKELVHIDLSRNRIKDQSVLVSLIEACPKLTYINLSGNQLHRLAYPDAENATLKVLFVANNKLTSLPDGVARISGLEYLNASFNPIRTLSMQLGQLKHLKELELIHAALSDNVELALPESIEKLSLAFNRFTAVPAGIRRCRNLTELDLSANPITRVPPWIGELSQLEGVFLRDTRIMKVGVEVVALKRLQTLDFSGSPVTHVDAVVTPMIESGKVITTGWSLGRKVDE